MCCTACMHRCVVSSMLTELVSHLLLLSVCLSSVHSLAADGDLWQGYVRRELRKSPSRPVVELTESLKARLPRTGISFDLSLAHYPHRERRGANCGLLDGTVLEHTPMELSETAEAVQAVWVAKDVILMVASSRGSSGGTTVWRGVPNSIGLFSFSPNHDVISETVSADSLQVSPADRSTLVVVSTSKQFLFVSRDTGNEWDRYSLPSPHFDAADDLYLSYKNPRHIVLHTGNGELYVSDSLGERWSHITSRVELVELALGRVDAMKEYLYYSTESRSSASPSSAYNPLYRLDIASRETHVIDHMAYRFRVDGRYLFVSRQNYSHDPAVEHNSRRLYVSKDYDSPSVTFSEVQLPSLRPEQLYIVMGTHETGAFIHVADKLSEPQGDLYSSDSSGSQFSISLQNHLYKVINNGLTRFSVYDFYEVESMRGVYITSTVAAGQDGHISMITFDNGGLWAKLRPPDDSDCTYPSCSLHLHLRYSQLVAPMYNVSSLSSPLSINTAVGIILAHGSLGSVRNDSDHRLFVSSDGGYTWKDPGLPRRTYVYGIADYGNIIAVAPDSEQATFIWFSHDRGSCFVRQELDSTGVFSLNRGLLVDPTAASRYTFVMGVEGVKAEDAWRVIALNFGSLLRTKCQKSDYSLVTEHATADSCLLGYKNVYNLTKPSSVCYNENGYNYNPVHVEKCSCDYTDYECDYGYKRTDRTSCSRDGSFNLAAVCPPGTATYNSSRSGFRLIPGDLCKATDQSHSLLGVEQRPCTGHELVVGGGGAVKHFVNTTVGKIIGVFVIVVVSLIAALFCLYCWLKCRSRSLSHERVFYQKLPLHDSSKFSANEDSSSEDEELVNAS